MITARKLKDKYLRFFNERGHVIIPSAALVPQNDPTTLFISAGMQPLVPYLLGETHPAGRRLVDCQKCLRTVDIDMVGDTFHNTFFEMLGNWSLGDYFKKESIAWSYEFLTRELSIDPRKLSVTVFAGDANAPVDNESAEIWKSLGIPVERIYFLPKEDNWWGPAGQNGPCGPDTEIFYDTGQEKCSSDCRPSCSCGKYCEIWNNVFMEFNKTSSGGYEPLSQKNVDTGMGVERTITILNGLTDNYQTEVFLPLIKIIESESGKSYSDDRYTADMRIICDHMKAAVFMVQDGITPSNKLQGYVMRRLIRRAVVKMRQLDIVPGEIIPFLCQEIINIYKNEYFKDVNSDDIHPILGKEADSFGKTIHKSTKILQTATDITGKLIFDLKQSYGLPPEIALELLQQWGRKINKEQIEKEIEQEINLHQEASRVLSAGVFKSGLADNSEQTAKLHTATHLLHAALRQILGETIQQKGSNITAERLRFDINYGQKLTSEEIKKTEETVNEIIKQNLPVVSETMALDQAIKSGALHFFGEKYPETVKVYTIGSFSKEICGGPHARLTGALGSLKIVEQESIGSNLWRIYANLK